MQRINGFRFEFVGVDVGHVLLKHYSQYAFKYKTINILTDFKNAIINRLYGEQKVV